MKKETAGFRVKGIIATAAIAAAATAITSCAGHQKSTPQQMTPPTSRRAPSAMDLVTAYPLNPRFERELPNEADDIAQIRSGILTIQAKEAAAHGKLLRGTHSKGVCVSGVMEIYDARQSAPTSWQRIKKGIFSESGKYQADIRFANAAGSINADENRDVRAVSFSLHIPPRLSNPQGLMDFSMNNAPTFPINDAQVFADLMKNLTNGAVTSEKDLGLWREGHVVGSIVKGKVVQEKAGKQAYQKMEYWSTVPFALGDDEAVKYRLKPCASNHAEPLDAKDPDKLKKELARNVNNDQVMSCFEFQVQLLEASKMTHNFKKHPAYWWVENASIEWSDKEAPFYTVGKLTLARNSVVDDQACEKRWIDVLANNNKTHHGLGSINRARTEAERASAERRLNQ